MPITIQCVHCGQSLRAPGEMGGKRVRCRKCGRDFLVPDKASSSDSIATPTPSSGMDFQDTLSRSMLPVRVSPPRVTDEMICRLEPGTLRWLDASPAAREFLDVTLEQLRRQTIFESLHPDDRHLARDEFGQVVEQGERHDFVLRVVAGDESWRYVRVNAQARYDAQGQLVHIRGHLQDVTARIRAEQELRRRTEQLTTANEQLRQANQKIREAQAQLVHSEKLAALGTLASGMAHEINNPLAFVANNVVVLERDVADLLRLVDSYQGCLEDLRRANPELASHIESIQDEIDVGYIAGNVLRVIQATRKGIGRVEAILQNLLGFARINRAEIDEIDINEALDQCLGVLNEQLSRQRIEVRRDYSELPRLECAASHLNQAILNLLTNASQAIEARGAPDGLMEVATRWAGDEILIEVADNGCGIPPENLPKIFDPFFTTKPVGQGTGLGLSISHGIIAMRGGRIEAHSKVGEGSQFRILLPLRQTPNMAPNRPDSHQGGSA